MSEFNAIGQQWEESEAGWGNRPDGYTLHVDKDAHKTFLDADTKKKEEDFKKTGVVPECYTRTSGAPFEVQLDDKTLEELKASKTGSVWGAVFGTIKEGQNGVLKIGKRNGGWQSG